MIPSRSQWGWSPEEDMTLARRKWHGESHKAIARDLNRTPASVGNRASKLHRKLERAHPDVLEQHRKEELALLEKLLVERSEQER